MKTTLQAQLDSDIPKDAVTTRTQAGTSLSYLTGAYVINRLNQILGQGNWSSGIVNMNKVFEGVVPNYKGEEVFNVSYTSTVQLVATIDNKQVFFTEIGYGDGMDKKNPGKAHELAVKEAATDGLKRAAKNLGISLGLGLYFKDGDYDVSETTNTVAATTTTSGTTPIIGNGSTDAKAELGGSTDSGKVSNGKSNSGRKANGTTGKSATKTTDNQREQLRLATRILIAQKKTTPEAILKDFLKGKKAAELSDADIQDAMIGINTKYPELNLLQGVNNGTTN